MENKNQPMLWPAHLHFAIAQSQPYNEKSYQVMPYSAAQRIIATNK